MILNIQLLITRRSLLIINKRVADVQDDADLDLEGVLGLQSQIIGSQSLQHIGLGPRLLLHDLLQQLMLLTRTALQIHYFSLKLITLILIQILNIDVFLRQQLVLILLLQSTEGYELSAILDEFSHPIDRDPVGNVFPLQLLNIIFQNREGYA